MSSDLIAVDLGTLILLAGMLVTVVLTPTHRGATFGRLARGFVGAMAVVTALAVAGRLLAGTGATSALLPYGDALELLWAPLVLLVAFSMFAGNQIDAERLAVRSLEHATDLVGVVAQTAQAGLLLLDPDGRITFANDAAIDLLELEEDPVLGSVTRPHWELHSAETGEGLASLAAGPQLRDAQVVVEWAGQQRRRHLSVNTLPLLRMDGTVCAVLAAFADRAPWLGAEQARL